MAELVRSHLGHECEKDGLAVAVPVPLDGILRQATAIGHGEYGSMLGATRAIVGARVVLVQPVRVARVLVEDLLCIFLEFEVRAILEVCLRVCGRVHVGYLLVGDPSVNAGSDVSCTITSNVTCTKRYLYDGSSFNVDIVVRPTAAGARTLTNTATVSSDEDEGYPDPNNANNTSTATTQVSDTYTPASDTDAPETTLTNKPSALSSDASPSFSFAANEGPPTFECKLDAGANQACASPKRYFLLAEGEHAFQVRAKDSSGNVDQTPAQHTWTVDSKDPKVTFAQRPGTATGPGKYDEWVTNDRSPTWAWTVEDPNLDPESAWCNLYESGGDYRDIFYLEPCSSPFTFEGDLPDGNYSFDVGAYDKAYNSGGADNYFEVDTVAPKFVSGKPTGRRVSQYADVMATFDDNVYGSTQCLKIYKRGSTTPLAISREYKWEDGYKYIDIDPKNWLRRDTWYTVKVGRGVTDGANNLEAPKTWSFKTK